MIELMEQQYRCGGRQVRPFCSAAQVRHRGCSHPLQRAVTDFAVDVPFGRVPAKLKEHYGIELSPSTIRRRSLEQAARIAAMPAAASTKQASKTIVAQMDGSLIPIVEPDMAQTDKRKGKKLKWKEAKLCLAHPKGSAFPVFGSAVTGGVAAAGEALLHCVRRCGFGQDSHVHGVGDGALWIAGQFEEQFGTQHGYLLDLCHVAHYLAQAAQSFLDGKNERHAWVECQKDRLKSQRPGQVLATLATRIEPDDIPDDDAPVRRCHRYLHSRTSQLNYHAALQNELPIGSGAIESAHKHVIQARIKRPGAWWRIENAENIIALRTVRANDNWDNCWKTAA